MFESILSVLGLTLQDAIVTAGSAAVVAFLVVVIYFAGFRQTARVDEAALSQLASAEGVGVAGAVFEPRGRAVLAKLSDGKLLIARVMGDGVGARVAPAASAEVRLRRDRLRVSFGDLGFPALSWKLKEQAPGWLKELAQE